MIVRCAGSAGRSAALPRLTAALVVLAVFATPVLAGPGGPYERKDRYLGPGRDVALLVFPLESILSAATLEPRFAVEARVDLGADLALAIRPVAVWYVSGGVADTDGAGIGGMLALQWYLKRPLAGPFIALQGGDIEAFVDGRRGRTVGGSAIFGYAWSRRSGMMMSVGLGLGYWHRMGVVNTGPVWPEILSLRFGLGWGWGHGS